MPKIKLVEGKYFFDAEDGSALIECPIWIETSKKNEAHPEGKPWIKLPKGNVTNRQYFSVDLFNTTNVDGAVEVEIKTSAPRVLGATGVKQAVVKYLDEASAAEYTDIVTRAVETYKASKAGSRKKRPEEMSIEELTAYLEALKNNTSYKAATTGPKSFIDCFTEEEYARYNELIALSQENKANMPRAKRGPLSDEEKAVRNAKRRANEITKAEKLLAMLQASLTADTASDVDDLSDLIDEE